MIVVRRRCRVKLDAVSVTGTPKQVSDIARLPSAEVEASRLNRTGRYCAVNRPYRGNREASDL